MKQLSSRMETSGEVSQSASRQLRETARFAGLIQVCRSHWSAGVSCQVAHTLMDAGVKEFREVDYLPDYLAYLETCIAQFEHVNYGGQVPTMICETEVRGWADYWQSYRDAV